MNALAGFSHEQAVERTETWANENGYVLSCGICPTTHTRCWLWHDVSATSTSGSWPSTPRITPYTSCFSLYMHVAHIGITTVAFIMRLRTHMTDATPCNDCPTLHLQLSTADMSQWGIVPLQFVTDNFDASVCERHWCYIFRPLCAQRCTSRNQQVRGFKKGGGVLNKTVLTVLHGIREARGLDD